MLERSDRVDSGHTTGHAIAGSHCVKSEMVISMADGTQCASRVDVDVDESLA